MQVLQRLHKPSPHTVRVFSDALSTALRASGLASNPSHSFDTGSIGAITTMDEFEKTFGGGELGELLRGVIVSLILVPSGVTGVLAGTVADRLSRKWTISLGAAIFAIGSAISAGSVTSLGVLMLGRCIAGLGEGLFLGILGVYLSEISPRHLRSQMLLLQQLYCTGAVAAGFFVCYGTVKIPSSMSWRFPFILQTFFASVLAVTAPFMPYSPRWLLSKGRREEAERIIDKLVAPEHADERRELMSTPPASKMSQWEAMKDIWSPGVRGRTILGCMCNIFQQLSGIDFVLFFAPLLFEQAGLDPSTSSFIASGVTGLVLVACVIAGTFYIDKVGRRKIWLVGSAATSFTLYVIGILYATGGARTPVGKWVVIVFIEAFAVSFTSSISLVTKLYAAEIQPSRTRAAATSFGQGMNQLVNFGVAVSGPFFLSASSSGPYLTYASFTALGCLFGYLFMPEVAGSSLEAIDKTFEGSAMAVSVPRIFQAARLTEVRQRKNSRSQSANLPGETRDEIRRHFDATELQTIGEDGAVAVEDDEEDIRVPTAGRARA